MESNQNNKNLLEQDHQKDRNWLIWVIIITSLTTYLLHNKIDNIIGKEYWFWFKGQAFFIWLMSIQIFMLVRNKAVAFILFGYATNNLLDEVFFNPNVLGLNEIVFAVIVPIIAYFIHKRNANTRL